MSDLVSNSKNDPYVTLICTHCDFFKEDEEDQLECSAFKILKDMLQRDRISPEEIKDVFK